MKNGYCKYCRFFEIQSQAGEKVTLPLVVFYVLSSKRLTDWSPTHKLWMQNFPSTEGVGAQQMYSVLYQRIMSNIIPPVQTRPRQRQGGMFILAETSQ